MEIFSDYSTPPPLAMLASAFCFAPNLHRLGRILPLRFFEPRFASHLIGIASA